MSQQEGASAITAQPLVQWCLYNSTPSEVSQHKTVQLSSLLSAQLAAPEQVWKSCEKSQLPPLRLVQTLQLEVELALCWQLVTTPHPQC